MDRRRHCADVTEDTFDDANLSIRQDGRRLWSAAPGHQDLRALFKYPLGGLGSSPTGVIEKGVGGRCDCTGFGVDRDEIGATPEPGVHAGIQSRPR